MTEASQLVELEAEIDLLAERLRRWLDAAPAWPPAARCRALIERLFGRIDQLRARLSAPLVVGVMGGTGVGKSSLVNALVGDEVSAAGKMRPTTDRPLLIARPGLTPQMLGIPSEAVTVVSRDHPLLAEIILIDCPDPDTSDTGDAADAAPRGAPSDPGAGSRPDASSSSYSEARPDARSPSAQADNLSRLRAILPHCDVLLLVSTQQKYRSAAVRREWIAAAPSAQWVFVQTHADRDADIRDDWRRLLPADRPADLFFVDSAAALEASRSHRPLPGEFAALVEYLRRTFGRAAQTRLRHSNLLGLTDHALQRCAELLAAQMPAVERLKQQAIERQQQIEQRMTAAIERAAIDDRRGWEQELLGRIAQRWGASPFSLVIRTYQSLGSILIGLGAARARSAAQLVLLGGIAAWRKLQQGRRATPFDEAAAAFIDEQLLNESALILRGFAYEAEVPVEALRPDAVARQTEQAVGVALGRMRRRIDEALNTLVRRNSGWFVRGVYEIAWLGVVGLVLFRLGKNFFYDSWWPAQPAPIEGVHAYLAGVFWVLAWSAVLVLSFSGRLRRSIAKQLRGPLSPRESGPVSGGPFRELIDQCERIEEFAAQCGRLRGMLSDSARKIGENSGQTAS